MYPAERSQSPFFVALNHSSVMDSSVANLPAYSVANVAIERYRVVASSAPWQQPKQPEEQLRSLESALHVGMQVYEMASSVVDQWADDVRENRQPFRLDDAKLIHALRGVWLQVVDALLAAVAEFERNGYLVAGAEQFRKAVIEARLSHINPDEALASIEELDRGGGIALGEAINELRGPAQR